MIRPRFFQPILFLASLLSLSAAYSFPTECPSKETLDKKTICVKNGMSVPILFHQFPNDWGTAVIKPGEAFWITESTPNEREYITITKDDWHTILLDEFPIDPCTTISQFTSNKFVGLVIRGCR